VNLADVIIFLQLFAEIAFLFDEVEPCSQMASRLPESCLQMASDVVSFHLEEQEICAVEAFSI
jgi:hypothetical protein